MRLNPRQMYGIEGHALLLGFLLAALVHFPEASAHESRPAYLQINQISRQCYEVLWHTPLLAGVRLPVVLRFSDGVRNVTEPVQQDLSGSLLERWVVEGAGGLEGKSIEFVGLQATITDVLVRIQMSDGARSTTLVHPSLPRIDIAAAQGLMAIAGAYLVHGIEHILFGFDHLLFVPALILIVRSRRVCF